MTATVTIERLRAELAAAQFAGDQAFERGVMRGREESRAIAGDRAVLRMLVARIETDCKLGRYDVSQLKSNPPQNPCALHVLRLIAGYRSTEPKT
jgi:hypothetical protein